MPTSTLERQIRACIDSFVEDLTTLIKQAAMESVQEALGGAPRRRGPGRPRKTASKRSKRIRRSSGDLDATAARILSHVKANPGSRVTEIASSLRKTSKDLRLPIQKLLEEKKLRTTGQRRGMQYHPAGRGPRKKATTRKKKARRSKRKTTRKAKSGRKTKKRSRKAA